MAESCLPLINLTDVTSIFEELTICKRMESVKQGKFYAEEEKTLYFGPLIVGQEVTTRIKLSNPSKVVCDVAIAVKSKGKGKEKEELPFTVEPAWISIPTHESRIVQLRFHPTSLQQYIAAFEAVVEGSHTEVFGNSLAFDVRGEGALPRVSADRSIVRFKKLFLEQSETQSLTFRNDGVLPVRFLLDWITFDSQISLDAAGQYLDLAPQESLSVPFTFRATKLGKWSAEMRLHVVENSFESTNFTFCGECYQDDLEFQGLDVPSSDIATNIESIQFGDCFVGQRIVRTINVTNRSRNAFQLVISSAPPISISPSSIILSANQNQPIAISLESREPINLKNHPIVFKYTSVSKNHKTQKIEDPDARHVEQQCERMIAALAQCEWSSYNITCREIRFKQTMMYQSRRHRFQINNPGIVRLDYVMESMDRDCITIEPESGSISPGEFNTITVKFSPREEGYYEELIRVHFANMSPADKISSALEIPVKGTCLRPFCHFDIPEAEDELAEKSSELVPRVLEFVSCGIRNKLKRSFYLLNPTQIDWKFEWIPSQADTSPFTCLTPTGLVNSGKRFEVQFDYFPEAPMISESRWLFSILNHNIQVPFVLIGKAQEPNIYLDHPSLSFKPILTGKKSKEIVRIVNSEPMSFPFQFHMNHGEQEENSAFRVHPSSGTVEAMSDVNIEVWFQPKNERHYSSQINCQVRRKSMSMTLNVRGEGYRVSASVHLESEGGGISELPNESKKSLVHEPAALELGRILVGELKLKKLILKNSGKYLFDYCWKINDARFVLEPLNGTVAPERTQECVLQFTSLESGKLGQVILSCVITNGPTFKYLLVGDVVHPLLRISPSSIDFGPSFVWKSGIPAPSPALTKVITFRNDDVVPLSVDVSSTNSSVFQVPESTLRTLNPHETSQISVTFVPKDAALYRESILVDVNGIGKLKVPLLGIGNELSLQLVRNDYRHVAFGALKPGQSSTKSIKLANKSLVSAPCKLGPASTLEILSKRGFEISPCVFDVKPKSSTSITVHFKPKERICAFAEELSVESFGQTFPLSIISGSALGINVSLESNIISFGPVAIGGSATKKITLINHGDLGVAFKWDPLAFLPEFKINPFDGYLAPGTESSLDLTFHPNALHPDFRKEGLLCQVEGVKMPLSLTLTGMCIPQPNFIDTIKFGTPVRTPEMKSIQISNKTNFIWSIKPLIDHPSWSGEECVIVEAGSTVSYELNFCPLEMNQEYAGTIFFPIPDGTGLVYKLVGVAEKPLAQSVINREVPCKKPFVESLKVHNWLQKPQKFKVIIEQQKPEPFVVVRGHDFIDVPGGADREYKFHYFSFKESVSSIRVVFKNESTGEYLYFLVNLKVLPPTVMANFDLRTTVRQSMVRSIVINNPLGAPANFTSHCNNYDINVPHQFSIPSQTELTIPFEFLPLLPKDNATAKLVFNSQELGTYVYDLTLQSIPASFEKTTHFKTTLGNQHVQTVRFLHFCKVKTEFTCKLDHGDFLIDKAFSVMPTVVAPIGTSSTIFSPTPPTEMQLDVTYEPSKLGDVNTMLTLTSPTGGEYNFPLHGNCSLPRPQGPILIRGGSNTLIPFKNVFNQPSTFNFSVDNSSFTVKPSETIPPKKTVHLTVNCRLQNSTAEVATGLRETQRDRDKGSTGVVVNSRSITVSSPGHAASSTSAKVGKLTVTHVNGGVSWIYYLKGI
jgi:hypothetical protein